MKTFLLFLILLNSGEKTETNKPVEHYSQSKISINTNTKRDIISLQKKGKFVAYSVKEKLYKKFNTKTKTINERVYLKNDIKIFLSIIPLSGDLIIYISEEEISNSEENSLIKTFKSIPKGNFNGYFIYYKKDGNGNGHGASL